MPDSFHAEHTGERFYEDAATNISHEWFSGLIQCPVAGTATDNSQACALIRVHSPYGKKIISWTVERYSTWPRAPKPQDLDASNVLLDYKIGEVVPVLSINGSERFYRLSGVYTYAQVKPSTPSDGLAGAVLPIDNATPDDLRVPGSAFVPDLLGGDSGASALRGSGNDV